VSKSTLYCAFSRLSLQAATPMETPQQNASHRRRELSGLGRPWSKRWKVATARPAFDFQANRSANRGLADVWPEVTNWPPGTHKRTKVEQAVPESEAGSTFPVFGDAGASAGTMTGNT
jgi:hypothetical protein